jgi:hypothetical protein
VPTLDDQFLDALLHEAGDSFATPPAGASAILRRIHRDDDEKAGPGPNPSARGVGQAVGAAEGEPAPPVALTRRRRIHRTVNAHRMLTVAAAVLVLLVVAGSAVRVWSGRGAPTRTFGANAVPATHSPTFGDPVRPGAAAPASVASRSAGSTSAGSVTPAPAASSTGTASKGARAQNVAGLGAGVVGQPARIEQTGSLDLRVGRGALSATIARLNALASANGGFVANSQTNSGGAGGGPSGTVTLEVPVATFSTVLREAQSLGTVSNLTTQATDVTAQYADLQSQITALEASRQQYLTIMTKAASIGDVLAVQAQLNTLQSQIQQLQGQLAVLGSETDYSKFTAVVTEPGAPNHHPAAAAPSGLDRAWHGSVHGFVAGAEGLIRIAGPALFVLLCLAAVLLGGQLFWRRLQRHNL